LPAVISMRGCSSPSTRLSTPNKIRETVSHRQRRYELQVAARDRNRPHRDRSLRAAYSFIAEYPCKGHMRHLAEGCPYHIFHRQRRELSRVTPGTSATAPRAFGPFWIDRQLLSPTFSDRHSHLRTDLISPSFRHYVGATSALGIRRQNVCECTSCSPFRRRRSSTRRCTRPSQP
jgi:hypothetical protein